MEAKTKTRKPTKITQFPPAELKEKFKDIEKFRNKIKFLRERNLFTNDFRLKGKIGWKICYKNAACCSLTNRPRGKVNHS